MIHYGQLVPRGLYGWGGYGGSGGQETLNYGSSQLKQPIEEIGALEAIESVNPSTEVINGRN